MRIAEAVEMIRPAIGQAGGTWADFGAGTGVFTRALAEVLGPTARVLAIDRDPHALAQLAAAVSSRPGDGPSIEPIQGDFQALAGIAALADLRLDGALFANALHFTPEPARVLSETARRVGAGGRVLVVEYQGRAPSPWVPHPISESDLEDVAAQAGLRFAGVVARRASRYGGTMYCAVLERPHA